MKNLNNAYMTDLSMEELKSIDGGLGALAWTVIGFCALFVAAQCVGLSTGQATPDGR